MTEDYCLTLDEANRKVYCSGSGLDGPTIGRELVETLLFQLYAAGEQRLFEAREYRIVPRKKPDA